MNEKLKGSTLIRAMVLLKGMVKGRFGYSKVYYPELVSIAQAVSYTGKKRKYTFSVARKATDREVNAIVGKSIQKGNKECAVVH